MIPRLIGKRLTTFSTRSSGSAAGRGAAGGSAPTPEDAAESGSGMDRVTPEDGRDAREAEDGLAPPARRVAHPDLIHLRAQPHRVRGEPARGHVARALAHRGQLGLLTDAGVHGEGAAGMEGAAAREPD